MAISVNNPGRYQREAQNAMREVLHRDMGFVLEFSRADSGPDRWFDLVAKAKAGKAEFVFAVKALSRITPQVALSTFQAMSHRRKGPVPVLYAPVVSPRVAEIAREAGVGYIDRAGNCRLVDRDRRLFVERQGFTLPRQPTAAASDPFAARSPKSTRIVRALLTQPAKGWQVRELAAHADVGVTPGLVVKVKQRLLDEGYAVEHDRQLYLRDPVGLLDAWSGKYAGPSEKIPVFLRGEPNAAEDAVRQWCAEHHLRYALAGFSAAWRLAPEVRFNVAHVYLEEKAFGQAMLVTLGAHGVRRVESGANLYLWRPFDDSVLASPTQSGTIAVTSPLQTYLDLMKTAGRGEDAAQAIYAKFLLPGFENAARRAKGWSHAAI